jgi:Na+-driven multidrug efflux pump
VNAILDPIFIFALDMNLAGAALASVAARIASASLSFYFLFKIMAG